MIKRLLAIAIGLTAVLAVATPAHGQQYPPANLFLTTCTTAVPGEECTLTAGEFLPGSQMTATFLSQPVNLGTATVNADGVASLTFTIPLNASIGTHTVTVSAVLPDGTPIELSTTIEVVAPGAGAAGARLPRTGTNTVPIARLGAGLLAVGGGLLFVTRRRRAAAAI